MPRADVARLIAENLANLPGSDGAPPVRLLQYSTAGKSPEQTAEVSRRALDVGNRIAALLENAGHDLAHRSDPPPADGEYVVVEAHCVHCGAKVLELSHIRRDPTRPDRWKAQLHKVALESMGHPHGCWK